MHQSKGRTKHDFDDALTRAFDMRTRGLHWLERLVQRGDLDREEALSFQGARGHADLASDLIALSARLTAHWSTIEPLQALEPDAEVRLTREDILEMAPHGEFLLDWIGGSPV